MKKRALLCLALIASVSFSAFSQIASSFTVSINQTACPTVGIKENPAEKLYRIHPNPSTGIIKIESLSKTATQNATLTITNILGSIVWQNSPSTAIGNITEVDLSAQPEGFYFVVVRERDKIVFEEKVIKK